MITGAMCTTRVFVGSGLANLERHGSRCELAYDRPLDQFLMGWTAHDAIHVADMLKALPECKNDPELTTWLARPEVAPAIGAYQKAMG